MNERSRVLIADDEPGVRESVRRALEKSPVLYVVAEAHDGVMAWEYLTQLKPDIAIVDIGMPGLDGIALVRRARLEGLHVDVIFLTVCDEEPMYEEALALGMKGYLLKRCTGNEIRKCVEAVASGGHCASPAVISHIIRKVQRPVQVAAHAQTVDDLTFQERAILRRIAQHKSSKEIAGEMGVSVRTVDTHRANICKKLGIHGNYGLSRYVAAFNSKI